jgi:tetratricopeptide (TPR) repeat protein
MTKDHQTQEPRASERTDVATDALHEVASSFAGRYQVVRTLGSGAFGKVLLAHDTLLERQVCIKILRAEASSKYGQDELGKRFLREAQAAAKLRHPNIVTVHDVVEHDGQLAIVMEYVEGETLRDRLHRQSRLGVEEAARLVARVAAGLDYAHEHGIVHRDIKPANVFLGNDGSVKVGDFGVALVHDKSKLTDGTAMVGTPAYMSPEQIQGQGVDRRSDVFSLGCMLFEMLAGRPPFVDQSVMALLFQIVHNEPPSFAQLGIEVPEDIDQVVHRALAKAPDRRYERARDMAAALATFDSAATAAVARQDRRWFRRWWAPVAGLAACGAVALAITWFAQVQRPIAIAVMPFENRTGRAESSFIALGFASELSRLLAEQPRVVLVPAGDVSDQVVRGRDVREAGRAAGAGWILSGALIDQGATVAMRYSMVSCLHDDRREETVPVVLDNLQTSVTGVRTQLLGWLQLDTKPTSTPINPQAYELYLRASGKINELTEGRQETVAQAQALLEKALEIEPSVEVYSGLALLHYESVNALIRPSRENLDLSRYYLEKGLALRPDFLPLLVTKVSLGIQVGRVEESLGIAAAQLMEGRLGVSFLSQIGLVLRQNGDYVRAAAFYDYGCHLLPHNYLLQLNRERSLFQSGRHDLALQHLQELARDDPEKRWTAFYLVYYSLLLGKPEIVERHLASQPSGLPVRLVRYAIGRKRGSAEAFEPSDTVLASASADFDTSLMLAECYALAGNTTESMAWLRKAIDNGWTSWSYFDWDPLLANLRQSREYKELREQGLKLQQARAARELAIVQPVMAKLGITPTT